MSTTPTKTHATTDFIAADKAPAAVDVAAVPMTGSTFDQHGVVVGKWKADIFGCFTDFVPNCLLASCCPCVSLAQTLHRIGMYSYTTVLALLLIAAFIVIRMRVRKAFDIPGMFVEDCFFTFCCSCCSIAQMTTHTESYDAQVCSLGPKDALPGYKFD
ncbi:hypothetical protein DYB38_011907 [Aphanomyces astaci]|uniref:PLAC8 family protein n=1 Tax=Aphanomyces astaci TaxID=112090 RepID=A0A397E0G0_APHAT|nr:hypothetical protein DYB38_011907 [Aphanomyces astaci]